MLAVVLRGGLEPDVLVTVVARDGWEPAVLAVIARKGWGLAVLAVVSSER